MQETVQNLTDQCNLHAGTYRGAAKVEAGAFGSTKVLVVSHVHLALGLARLVEEAVRAHPGTVGGHGAGGQEAEDGEDRGEGVHRDGWARVSVSNCGIGD